MTSADSEKTKLRLASLAEADALIAQLQSEAEVHKTNLARTIHDELGGLMVSAAMDLTMVRRQLAGVDNLALEQLDRSKKTLESAIDLTRRLVEELRPSILDNFGLVAALKWHMRRASEGSGATLTESYPGVEPDFRPAALTALFRVAQEAITMMFKRANLGTADIRLEVNDSTISMRFTDDGIPNLVDGMEVGTASALASMRHRMQVHGGTVELQQTTTGGSILSAYMPLSEAYKQQADLSRAGQDE